MILTLGLGGCYALEHGYTLEQYKGQLLQVRGGGPGATRLRIESAYDPSVRHFVAQYGDPDYLLVTDRRTVNLIYLGANQVAVFKRSSLSPRSEVALGEISRDIIPYLDSSERLRLGHTRDSPLAVPGTPPTSASPHDFPSVVRIQARSYFGSGFFVTPSRIVTNAHVLAGARSASVSSGHGPRVAATVVYVDTNLDFAVLQSPVTGVPMSLRTDPVTDGEGVMALGFPQGRDVVAGSTGTIRGISELLIMHDALIAGGSSGGPLVDRAGRVLGVNTMLAKRRGDKANVTDRALAIKITTILRSLGSQ